MENIKNINSVRATFSKNKLANIVFNVNTTNNKHAIFFGNVERTANFDILHKQNKNCLSSSDGKHGKNGHLIRNLYPSDMCFYKSAIYDSSKTARTETTYDFQNITNHKMSAETALYDMIQVDNIMYTLEPKTQFGRYSIKCDIYSYISANTGFVLPPNSLISTAIYDISAIDIAIKLDNIELLQLTAVSANLSNIHYNMLYEIPGTVYNDYESGNIAANTFKCKNAFNSIYNMEHNEDHVLNNARDYINVNNCNKQVYLTYNDNISYDGNLSQPIKNDSGYANLKCEHVEMLGSMNRYANLNGHKSNLYSIAVYTNIFNCMKLTTLSAQRIKENLKDELQHTVRNIVNKLLPINTQLLSVFINEIN